MSRTDRDAFGSPSIEWLMPALSGLLLALSYPPLHPLLLPFVGLVPFVLWVQGLPAGHPGSGMAMRGGAVFGAVYFGLLFYWILFALIWFTWLAIPAYLLVVGALVAFSALLARVLHRAVNELGAPIWLALPVVWTGFEWIRGNFPSTLALPWLGLGTALTGFPELVGVAEIVGARGVTFWIASVNGLVVLLLLRLRAGHVWWKLAVTLAVVVVAPAGWGLSRARSLDLRSLGQVAVVQPNIAEHLKLDPIAGRDSTNAALERLLPRLGPNSARLVVLPEVVFELFPEDGPAAPELGMIQRYSREIGAPVLFGGLGADTEPGGEPRVVYNSAFLMEPQGLSDFRYDKHRLVPVVERVPFAPARIIGPSRHFGAYGAGVGRALAEVDESSFGVLICYESAFEDEARATRLEGADVLVNLTNDAWYGREPRYTWTSALWQHPAHLVMRAIENRVGVVRSANTGVSLYVDPIGRVQGPSRLFSEDVLVQEVFTTDSLTVYSRLGDLVGTACAVATFGLLLTLLGPIRRRMGYP